MRNRREPQSYYISVVFCILGGLALFVRKDGETRSLNIKQKDNFFSVVLSVSPRLNIISRKGAESHLVNIFLPQKLNEKSQRAAELLYFGGFLHSRWFSIICTQNGETRSLNNKQKDMESESQFFLSGSQRYISSAFLCG